MLIFQYFLYIQITDILQLFGVFDVTVSYCAGKQITVYCKMSTLSTIYY